MAVLAAGVLLVVAVGKLTGWRTHAPVHTRQREGGGGTPVLVVGWWGGEGGGVVAIPAIASVQRTAMGVAAALVVNTKKYVNG